MEELASAFEEICGRLGIAIGQGFEWASQYYYYNKWIEIINGIIWFVIIGIGIAVFVVIGTRNAKAWQKDKSKFADMEDFLLSHLLCAAVIAVIVVFLGMAITNVIGRIPGTMCPEGGLLFEVVKKFL